SEIAGNFAFRAAWRALSNAFSMNVVPVSSTEWMPRVLCVTSSRPSGASNSLISRSLPTLLLASTTCLISNLSVQRLCLQREQLSDTARGEIEHGVELVPPKRVPLGRALNLDERAAVVHDDVHVGFRLRVLRVIE